MAASEVPGPPPRVRAAFLVLAPVVLALAAVLGRARPPPGDGPQQTRPAIPLEAAPPPAPVPSLRPDGGTADGGYDPASGTLFWLLPQTAPPMEMDDD
jgi:hypothetical protein